MSMSICWASFSRNRHLNSQPEECQAKNVFPQTADKDTSRRACFCPPGWVSPFQVMWEGVEYILVRQSGNFRVVWLILTFLSQGRQRNQLSAEKCTSASRKTKHAAAFLLVRLSRGVTREGHEGRAHPPKNFDFGFLEGVWRDHHCFPAPFSWFLLNADLSWRPEDHFRKLFVIEMSPERHEKSERRPPVSWRPCAGVQPRSSVQLVTYHACQRSGTTCCSASDHLKESHDSTVKAQEKATRTAWQSTISSGQLWLIRILQLLISSFGVLLRWSREREWWEAEVTSALHCVLWETKHPSARSPQWISDSSNSFLPQQCKWWSWVLFDKEAGSPGNSIALLKFQAQADDAALLRNFHCNTY